MNTSARNHLLGIETLPRHRERAGRIRRSVAGAAMLLFVCTIVQAQTPPAKCTDVSLGAWTPVDSTTLPLIDDQAGDSLWLWSGSALCIVGGVEWIRRTAPPTTPAGAFVRLNDELKAYMRVAQSPDALWAEIVGPWYLTLPREN